MTKQRKKTAYGLLLAAVLLVVMGILGIGNIRGSYVNKGIWNTIMHPKQPVISNCLTADGQVILLGEVTAERRIEVWFEASTEDIGVLELEFLDPSQEAYLTASLLEDTISLSENRTYAYMDLIPTELASELAEAMVVEIRMTMETQAENEVLSGIFRLTLPAKEAEEPGPGGTVAEPGGTASLIFKFKDVFNVDGIFTVEDPDEIVSDYAVSVVDAGATAAVVQENMLWAVPAAEPVKTDVSVAVEVTLKSDAAPGKVCTVSFTGIYGDGNGEPGNEMDVYQSATVTVKQAETSGTETTEETLVLSMTFNTAGPEETNGADLEFAEMAQEEQETSGELSVSSLADFSLKGYLPISMILPANSMTLTATLGSDTLPAFTRYSVDGGETWFMLYYGGQIRVDAAEMPLFESGQSLLVDLYYTEWDSANPVRLSIIVYTETGVYTGEVVSEATAPLFRTRAAMTPLIMNADNSLVFAVSENWSQCEAELCLERLELYDGVLSYSQVTDDSIYVEFGEADVSVEAGAVLPLAGTYRLTIFYRYGGICFAESEIIFFANYSSVT